jgi:hypothetical protein
MFLLAFALSYAQAADDCSSADDVCLLQLKSNTGSFLDAQVHDDPISLLSSESDAENEESG